ncbi:MAG: CrcB family protein [Actinomycetota bacterium]
MTRSSSGRNEPAVLAAIAGGGALGGLCRYGVLLLIPVGPNGFPWATFWTNISGSLLLGALLTTASNRFPSSRYIHPFFATGLLGSYTTFSTFAVEVDLLSVGDAPAIAAIYCAASLVAGLAAAWIGMLLGRLLTE